MKKLFLFLLAMFFLIIPVKAELTEEQENDVAAFASNFIIEGNKILDSNGLPILAYNQNTRAEGFKSKTSYLSYSYIGGVPINAKKWTFDCASFVSYVYYHTFGLKLTRNDGDPYLVRDFTSDSGHFYTIKSGIKGSEIKLKDLRKGDLLIQVGHHIVIYVGDGKVAEATVSSISKSNKNLGLQVIKLEKKYANTILTVKRLKDNIIAKDAIANTKVKWPGEKDSVDLVPKPSISHDELSVEWAKTLMLSFSFYSKVGLKSYSFSKTSEKWNDISGKSYNLDQKVSSNGTYILKVKDKKGFVTTKKISVENIDNNPPLINNITVKNYNSYSTISVKAIDNEAGLASKSYSFDGGKNWDSKKTYRVEKSGKYNIKVRDNVGNINSQKIDVKVIEIILNKKKAKLNIDETFLLKAVTNSGDNLKWTSSDTKVATVGKTGKVKAKSEGSAIISVTAGDITAKCQITVTNDDFNAPETNLESMSIMNSDVDVTHEVVAIEENEAITLTPKTATVEEKVNWTSSNPEVAEVDENGVVVGKSSGKTIITATSNNETAVMEIEIEGEKPDLKENEKVSDDNSLYLEIAIVSVVCVIVIVIFLGRKRGF